MTLAVSLVLLVIFAITVTLGNEFRPKSWLIRFPLWVIGFACVWYGIDGLMEVLDFIQNKDLRMLSVLGIYFAIGLPCMFAGLRWSNYRLALQQRREMIASADSSPTDKALEAIQEELKK